MPRSCSPAAAGAVAGRASADTIPDGDLAYARLLVGAELLALDFHTLAIASKELNGDALRYAKRALFNEEEHYKTVSEILSGAGQPPAVTADFDFAYPKGAFTSKASIAKLGVTLETIFLGAYLGAVDGLQTDCAQAAGRPDRGQRGSAPERVHGALRRRSDRDLLPGPAHDRRGFKRVGYVHELDG